jgi:hypothetical protein
MENYFEKLTDLQRKVGYSEGEINPIAMLGLIGEVGEVLGETVTTSNALGFDQTISIASFTAELIDLYKKEIRDKKSLAVEVFVPADNEDDFDKEIADVLYYLNAIAINRGKSLDYYAKLSFDKVSAKVQIDVAQGSN